MKLSVADIDRWSAGAVREVFRAASARAQVTLEVSRQLGSLAVFDTWNGATAKAAKHQTALIRQDLDVHGDEALAVARAADKAADGIEYVQSQLRQLRADTSELQMAIDPLTNTVLPGTGFRGGPMEVLLKTAQLQPRLDAIVAEANTVDGELATAINMADGDARIPADAGPPVGPQGLTPTQRASDANEARLCQARADLQGRIDELKSRYEQLVKRGDAKGSNNTASARLRVLGDELRVAHDRIAEFDSINTALRQAPDTYLTQLRLPTDAKQKVGAVVAVGNPDAAVNIAVSVPGLGSTTRDSLPEMVIEAWNLQTTANGQLKRLSGAGSVVTVAFMGYDPPPNPINTTSPCDLWRTICDGRARAGAAILSAHLQQLHANNPRAHISLFGHSYGSLTASLALQQLNAQGLHPVNDAVFYGSPGLELGNPDQLGLANGHAYVMRAIGHDAIPELAPLARLHGWGADPYLGTMPELSSQAGVSPDGVERSGVMRHADYSRAVIGPDGEPVLRMSGYNLAVIAAGIADEPGGGKRLMMAATPLTPHPHPGQ
jgi:alpha/beta hydrolase family protein